MKKIASFIVLIIVAILYLFNQQFDIIGNVPLSDSFPIYESEISVYFCPRDKCEEVLASEFAKSDKILCAMYDWELEGVIPDDRDVKFIFDDHNVPDKFKYQHKDDNHDYLMHNKFCILDDERVITGSYNPTQRGTYFNNNNLVVIKSIALARDYTDEFDEMWAGTYHKGDKKTGYSSDPEVYFCPEDGCQDALISLINNAQESIYFMTFSFTSQGVADALLAASKRGIQVSGIFEKAQNSKYSKYQFLKDAKLPVYIDRSKYNMHHKSFIVDRSVVITGSYNPSNNGNKRNDENMIVLRDSKVAEAFLKEFEYLVDFDEGPIYERTASLIDAVDPKEDTIVISNPFEKTIDLNHYYIYKFAGTLRNSYGIVTIKNESREEIDFYTWG